MSKKNKPSSFKPFDFINKETSNQLNTIANIIEYQNLNRKEKIDSVKLAIDIVFELENAGYKILKVKEKNFLFVNKKD